MEILGAAHPHHRAVQTYNLERSGPPTRKLRRILTTELSTKHLKISLGQAFLQRFGAPDLQPCHRKASLNCGCGALILQPGEVGSAEPTTRNSVISHTAQQSSNRGLEWAHQTYNKNVVIHRVSHRTSTRPYLYRPFSWMSVSVEGLVRPISRAKSPTLEVFCAELVPAVSTSRNGLEVCSADSEFCWAIAAQPARR